MAEGHHIYIAGPMRGYPEFNFPAFFDAELIAEAAGYDSVFNPARRDTDAGFDPTGLEGTMEELAEHDFSLRDALGADTAWICSTATAIYMLEGWENSSGARAERALALALGHEVIYQAGSPGRTPDEVTAYEQGRADGEAAASRSFTGEAAGEVAR